jgi:hypothetical protein
MPSCGRPHVSLGTASHAFALNQAPPSLVPAELIADRLPAGQHAICASIRQPPWT